MHNDNVCIDVTLVDVGCSVSEKRSVLLSVL